jgi:nitrogen regulatory protein PII
MTIKIKVLNTILFVLAILSPTQAFNVLKKVPLDKKTQQNSTAFLDKTLKSLEDNENIDQTTKSVFADFIKQTKLKSLKEEGFQLDQPTKQAIEELLKMKFNVLQEDENLQKVVKKIIKISKTIKKELLEKPEEFKNIDLIYGFLFDFQNNTYENYYKKILLKVKFLEVIIEALQEVLIKTENSDDDKKELQVLFKNLNPATSLKKGNETLSVLSKKYESHSSLIKKTNTIFIQFKEAMHQCSEHATYNISTDGSMSLCFKEHLCPLCHGSFTEENEKNLIKATKNFLTMLKTNF